MTIVQVYQFVKREDDAIVLADFSKIQKRYGRGPLEEMKTVASGASTSLATPCRERRVSCSKSTTDNCNDCVIRKTVNGCHITDKLTPMLKKLHEKLVYSVGYTGRLSTLRKVIMRLGFR